MLRTVLWLVANDLRLFFRDRVAVLLGFALPIVLVGIFGFVMGAMGGGSDDGVQAVDVAIADEDASPASAAFVQALRESTLVRPRLKKEGRYTREELRARLDEGDDAFALAIPEGFADGAELVLLRDPGRDMEWRLVQMGLATALFRARGGDAAFDMTQRAMLAAGLPDEARERLRAIMVPFRLGIEGLFSEAERDGQLAHADAPRDPLAFFEHALPLRVQDVVPEGRDRQLTYMISHAVSGMTVMMLMFTLVGCARSLLEERSRGTLKRLLAAPIDPHAILLAKFVTGWLMGLVLIAVLYTFAWAVFDVDVASRWSTLLVVSMATAAACTSFAIAIAAWARTDKQADGVSTLLILSMSALGGAWFPAMIMPPAAKVVAKFTLTYWSLSGYQESLWYGRHWTDAKVLLPVGVVLAVALALGALASVQFRRRYLSG